MADLTSLKNEAIAKLIANSRQEKLDILITGKTGVGKSRLVNALIWRNIAEEGRQKDSCTNTVTPYKVTIEGIDIFVWDSPGLQDGSPYDAKSYIANLKSIDVAMSSIDVVIYCLKMDDTKFYEEDKKVIRELTRAFGKETWKKAVIALTFANKIEDPNEGDEKTFFVEDFSEWKRQLDDILTKLDIDFEVRKTLPIVPAGNYKKRVRRLPTCDDWLGELWTSCFSVMSDSAGVALYQISKDRVIFPGSEEAPAAAISSESDTSQRAGPSVPEDDPTGRKIHLTKEQEKTFWKKLSKMSPAIGSLSAVAAIAGIIIAKAL